MDSFLIVSNVTCGKKVRIILHYVLGNSCKKGFLSFPFYKAFLNKFQRAKDAMEYARKSAAESATATVSHQMQSPVDKFPGRFQSNRTFVSILSFLVDSESPNSKLKNKLVCVHPSALDSHSRQFKFS